MRSGDKSKVQRPRSKVKSKKTGVSLRLFRHWTLNLGPWTSFLRSPRLQRSTDQPLPPSCSRRNRHAQVLLTRDRVAPRRSLHRNLHVREIILAEPIAGRHQLKLRL